MKKKPLYFIFGNNVHGIQMVAKLLDYDIKGKRGKCLWAEMIFINNENKGFDANNLVGEPFMISSNLFNKQSDIVMKVFEWGISE